MKEVLEDGAKAAMRVDCQSDEDHVAIENVLIKYF